MNTNHHMDDRYQQSPALQLKMHRTPPPPPPPPSNPPATSMSNRTPPRDKALEAGGEESSPPPQAPARTNKNSATLQYSQIHNNSLNQPQNYQNSSSQVTSVQTPTAPLRSAAHQASAANLSNSGGANLAHASNAAAKLVHKSAMMGSVHSLANPSSYPYSQPKNEQENLKNSQVSLRST